MLRFVLADVRFSITRAYIIEISGGLMGSVDCGIDERKNRRGEK